MIAFHQAWMSGQLSQYCHYVAIILVYVFTSISIFAKKFKNWDGRIKMYLQFVTVQLLVTTTVSSLFDISLMFDTK